MATRDMAYHNGTVWAWLMGPYVSAYTKVNNHSKKSREHARAIARVRGTLAVWRYRDKFRNI